MLQHCKFIRKLCSPQMETFTWQIKSKHPKFLNDKTSFNLVLSPIRYGTFSAFKTPFIAGYIVFDGLRSIGDLFLFELKAVFTLSGFMSKMCEISFIYQISNCLFVFDSLATIFYFEHIRIQFTPMQFIKFWLLFSKTNQKSIHKKEINKRSVRLKSLKFNFVQQFVCLFIRWNNCCYSKTSMKFHPIKNRV